MLRGRLSIFITALLALPVGQVRAQLERLDSREQFSEEAVVFDLSLYRFADDAGRVLGAWGIELQGTAGSKAVVLPEPVVNFSTIPVIELHPRNESMGQALVLNFSRPVRRVGFNLGNAPPNDSIASALISAFDLAGKALGNLQVDKIEGKFGDFVGVETTSTAGISKLIVDYGNSQQSERLSEFTVDFMAPSSFLVYLPQVAEGPLPGSGRLQSILLIINSSGLTNRVSLDLFDQKGNSQQYTFDGTRSDHFEFVLDPGQSLRLATDQEPKLTSGYGRLIASQPIRAQTVFRTLDGDSTTREAGIEGSSPGSYLAGYAEWNRTAGFGTGIALVFFGDQPRVTNQIQLHLVGRGSKGLIEEYCEIGSMERGEKRAFFLSELFAEIVEFQGTVILQGTSDFVAALVRTKDGLAISGLLAGGSN